VVQNAHCQVSFHREDSRRLNLLDRYILKSVLFTCLGAVALFLFIFALANVVKDLLGYVLAGQLSFSLFVHFVWLLIPAGAIYSLPLGLLTGVLLTLGRLSADSEITAMRTAGLSLARIARPIFVLGALCTALALYFNFESMPKARVTYHKELPDAVRANPLSFIVPRTFIRDFPGVVVYIGEKQGSVLRDIWVWRLDSSRRVTEFIRAGSGHFDVDDASNDLILTLTAAQVEKRDEKKPENFEVAPYLSTFGQIETVRLSLDRLFGRSVVRQKMQWMTYSELEKEHARVSAEPVPPGEEKAHARAVMKVQLTVQEKFTMAVSVLAFAFVAVPLGIRVSRRETSANLGIAVCLAIGHYLLSAMVGQLDRHPEYRPDLLLWLPNIIFLTVGVVLFRRLDR
jgi:lipopolysaccharide export system permease protein